MFFQIIFRLIGEIGSKQCVRLYGRNPGITPVSDCVETMDVDSGVSLFELVSITVGFMSSPRAFLAFPRAVTGPSCLHISPTDFYRRTKKGSLAA